MGDKQREWLVDAGLRSANPTERVGNPRRTWSWDRTLGDVTVTWTLRYRKPGTGHIAEVSLHVHRYEAMKLRRYVAMALRRTRNELKAFVSGRFFARRESDPCEPARVWQSRN